MILILSGSVTSPYASSSSAFPEHLPGPKRSARFCDRAGDNHLRLFGSSRVRSAAFAGAATCTSRLGRLFEACPSGTVRSLTFMRSLARRSPHICRTANHDGEHITLSARPTFSLRCQSEMTLGRFNISLSLLSEHFQKPASIPDQVRDRLFRDHVLSKRVHKKVRGGPKAAPHFAYVVRSCQFGTAAFGFGGKAALLAVPRKRSSAILIALSSLSFGGT